MGKKGKKLFMHCCKKLLYLCLHEQKYRIVCLICCYLCNKSKQYYIFIFVYVFIYALKCSGMIQETDNCGCLFWGLMNKNLADRGNKWKGDDLLYVFLYILIFESCKYFLFQNLEMLFFKKEKNTMLINMYTGAIKC